MKKGFTLLELIVVIIIIGILATLGFAQYTKVIEKGRMAEARRILGAIRSAEESYKQEYDTYSDTFANIAVTAPTACSASHYFTYNVTSLAGNATRCTSGGKTPSATWGGYVVSVGFANGTLYGNLSGYY